jgi:hypothetical protein
LPFAVVGGAVAALVAIVVVLLISLGGSAGKDVKNASATRNEALALLAANGTSTVSQSAPGFFAEVTTGKITAVVPAGWRATAQAAGSTARAEFADPKHAGSNLTIVTEGAGAGSDHARAEAAAKAVRSRSLPVSSYGPVEFPGGRTVWHLTYTKNGVTNATYFFTACNGKDAMVVDAASAAAAFGQEQGKLLAVAAGAEPLC